MPPDSLLALLTLAMVAAFTPGPNNALVASSGATFGLRRTTPHVLGIGLGFPLMVFTVGALLAGMFQASPVLREGLRWGGAAILIWLAWRIATAGGLSGGASGPRPFTFVEAAAFQWINPKAWTFAVAITAQFVQPDAPLATAAIVGGVFVVIGLSSATAWAMLGHAMTRWLRNARQIRWFNRAMAVLIVASVALLFAN